jgi:hypothetical protein
VAVSRRVRTVTLPMIEGCGTIRDKELKKKQRSDIENGKMQNEMGLSSWKIRGKYGSMDVCRDSYK